MTRLEVSKYQWFSHASPQQHWGYTLKKELKNFVKEMEEKKNKKLEEMNKSLKESQDDYEKTIKQVRGNWNRVKKTPQTKGTLEMKNLGKWTGTTDASITNRMQEIEERISSAEDRIEE